LLPVSSPPLSIGVAFLIGCRFQHSNAANNEGKLGFVVSITLNAQLVIAVAFGGAIGSVARYFMGIASGKVWYWPNEAASLV
jgi:hypothetical protein